VYPATDHWQKHRRTNRHSPHVDSHPETLLRWQRLRNDNRTPQVNPSHAQANQCEAPSQHYPGIRLACAQKRGSDARGTRKQYNAGAKSVECNTHDRIARERSDRVRRGKSRSPLIRPPEVLHHGPENWAYDGNATARDDKAADCQAPDEHPPPYRAHFLLRRFTRVRVPKVAPGERSQSPEQPYVTALKAALLIRPGSLHSAHICCVAHRNRSESWARSDRWRGVASSSRFQNLLTSESPMVRG
jgi:hypothetical protein